MSDSPSYDFQAAGLTPAYIKTCIEELAEDQLDIERRISTLNRQSIFTVGGMVLCLGVSMLTVKMIKNLMGGMQGLGQALYATQQAVGLIPTGEGVVAPQAEPVAGTVPDEDVPPASKSSEQAPTRSDEREQSPFRPSLRSVPTAKDNDTVEIGASADVSGPVDSPTEPLPPVPPLRENDDLH